MKDVDILMDLYKEQRELGLHHERQRNAITGFFLTVAAILLTIIGFDKELTSFDLPMSLAIIVAGVFGAIFTLKHYERFRFHRHRSRILRDAIDAALNHEEESDKENREARNAIRKTIGVSTENSPLLIRSLVSQANKSYREKEPFLFRWDLHKLWASVHVFISVIGIIITVMVVYSMYRPS